MEKQEKEGLFLEMKQVIRVEVGVAVNEAMESAIREELKPFIRGEVRQVIQDEIKPFIQGEISRAFGVITEYFDGKFALILECLDMKADKSDLLALEYRVDQLELE